MITGRDIVYISSIEWNFLWQGHQEIALRLGAAGNRVLYIENTGVRSPRLRDAGRVARRLKRWAGSARSQGMREVAPNIHVCSPLVMPPFGSQWRRAANRHLFLPALLRVIKQLEMRDLILWTYLPNDTALNLIDALQDETSALVYYCVADFSQLTPHKTQLLKSEKQIVKASDVVFTNCSELAHRFLPLNSNTHVFPVGVNLEAFPLEVDSPSANAIHSNGHGSIPYTQTADFVRSLQRPIVGYVGGMHRHVDFKLIKRMAEKRPDWSWVYVGAAQTDVEQLAALPNVYLMGQRPHEELVNYIRQFDVCTVPYINSGYTATVVPTKINEYLAVSKPVVATALPTILEFNNEHRVLITTEPRDADFLEALEKALHLPSDIETLAARRRVAELNDWTTRFNSMCALIEQQLRTKH